MTTPSTVTYNDTEYLCDLDEHNVPYNLRVAKNYVCEYDVLHNIDLTDSYPAYFLIKNNNIVIVDSETTLPNWIAIVKSLWNSMELKRVVYNTSFDLLQKETIAKGECVYKRGDIILPFTMKNLTETFRNEIIRLVNMNEYTIDITIKWENRQGCAIHYKNY